MRKKDDNQLIYEIEIECDIDVRTEDILCVEWDG